MKQIFLKINDYFIIDKAISFGVMTRIWSMFSGLINMLVISYYFSGEQQGYFFTFGNLLALQILFELGLTQVIAQFTSHEFADLSWGENGKINGDQFHLQRLEELLVKSLRLFALASILISVILIPFGIYFFSYGHSTEPAFSWRLPWILAVLGTSANLFIVPFFSIIMGSGDVAAVNYRELLGGIYGFCAAWVIIIIHGGLYAFCALTWGSAIISWIYLIRSKPELFKFAMKGIFSRRSQFASKHSILWLKEIWPLQWKTAASWMFGYFISNLFNPVLFYYQGAVVAGQMGLTLSATNGLFALSITWLVAKSPEFGKYIARHEWQKLDNLFFKALLPSVVVVSIGSLLGWIAIWYLQQHSMIGNRFIPANQAALLFGSFILQVAIHGFALYLRAHKQEPLLLITIVGSLLTTCSTIYFGKEFSSMGVVGGYFTLQVFVGLPIAYLIWYRCRREWHRDYN